MARKEPKGSERRRFPRKAAEVKVKLAAIGVPGISFEAHLPAIDVSIGGIFLQSEFFIKLGSALAVAFELPGVAEPVRVRGLVVREQRPGPGRGELRSGFAIEFTEFEADARLALAGYFLAPEIRAFVKAYLRRGRQHRIRGEEERMVDLIVAWEMDRLDQSRVRLRA